MCSSKRRRTTRRIIFSLSRCQRKRRGLREAHSSGKATRLTLTLGAADGQTLLHARLVEPAKDGCDLLGFRRLAVRQIGSRERPEDADRGDGADGGDPLDSADR